MKIRIADRVFVALAGVLLLAMCVCVIAQAFFAVPVLETVQGLLTGKNAVVWLPYILCAVLLALGGYCFALLFRRRRGKRGFVQQDTDGGELSIALSAMDGLVGQCVAVHEEMQLLESHVETDREGVVVDLRVALCSGVSIPLAVDALQKQIRQYVTSCSGVTVHEVRVQVDSMDNQPVETPYAVPAMLQSAVPAPLLTRGEDEAAEKAMHQRIFSDPQPVTAEAAEEETETEEVSEQETEEAAENDADAGCADDAAQPEEDAVAEPQTDETEMTDDAKELLPGEVNDEAAE